MVSAGAGRPLQRDTVRRQDDDTLELHIALLAEDPLVRGALARALADASAGQLTSAGSPTELESALRQGAAPPDALLWDAGLRPRAALRLPEVDAPVLALVPDADAGEAALEAGARGLLRREASAGQLRAGLRALAQGLLVFEPSLAPLRTLASPPAHLPETLTPREREVLQLLAQGGSNKDIAARLGISEHTAKFHVNAVLQKLGVQRRTEAVVRAARLGWVTL
jgi:two-component system, NarL family, nitrate/nitrite response regulator NarL